MIFRFEGLDSGVDGEIIYRKGYSGGRGGWGSILSVWCGVCLRRIKEEGLGWSRRYESF